MTNVMLSDIVTDFFRAEKLPVTLQPNPMDNRIVSMTWNHQHCGFVSNRRGMVCIFGPFLRDIKCEDDVWLNPADPEFFDKLISELMGRYD